MQEVEIRLNGEGIRMPLGATVADLIRLLELPEDSVAVELDRRIVRRSEWAAQQIKPGAAVEIVQIVGGG